MPSIHQLINNSSLLIGTRAVMKGISEKKMKCVILAADADEVIKNKITLHCSQAEVEVLSFHSKRELGTMAGIDVQAAVVGIKK